MRVLAATIALAAAAASAPAMGAGVPATSDLGAATLLALDRVTVVYPGGTADAEINRRSAEDRALWLQRGHGIETRVIADRDVRESDLKAHLLVLGWDNGLLGTERAPLPFRRTPDALEFGRPPAFDAAADLVIFQRSPYDADHFLMFWSRIDPELDRFMELPVVGSDWAVYDGFLPLAQGMFEEGGNWPPRRNPNAEKDHRSDLASLRALRVVRESPHYRLHYARNELSEEQADRVLAARESALAQAASLLHADVDGVRIALFVYADTDAKTALTGVPDAVHSVPRSGQMHMLEPYALSASAHEELHHVAYHEFGPCFLSSMYEGLVLETLAAATGEDLSLRTAVMMEQGTLPSLEDLLVEGRMASLPAAVGFPASAVMFRWLRESFGDGPLPRVYSLDRGGVAALADVLGVPARKLERSWKRWTAGCARDRADEVAYLKVLAAVAEARLVGDDAGVAEKLRAALELKPRDPLALLQLGAAETRLGEYGSARQRLEQLLALPLEKASGYPIRAHFALGRLFDVQGLREEAIEQYRLVLELPNEEDLHLRAREAIETPVTRDRLD